jgi:[ribosomal protein S5]-alanine N-acetyltransferase
VIGLLRRVRRGVEPILTRRLQLVAMTSALLNAEAHDDWHLREALRARLAPDWPPEHWEPPVRAHILAQLTTQPETVGWHRYMLLVESKPVLVGCVGAFPCAAGDVELGYSVATSFQRRGYATEAAGGLIAWLLQQPSVHSVSAQAYETSPASVTVMQRCGMRLVGAGDEAGTVRYRRWR